MSSPYKPLPKPSRVAKMSARPTWKKKVNHCNSSNEVDANLPTPMPKLQSPINEPTTQSNHVSLQSHSLPLTSVLHAQTPPSPQGDNRIQPLLSPSPSREMLMNDINQLQELSNLLAMQLSQCLYTAEEMAGDRFGAYWLGSERVIPNKGILVHGPRGSYLFRHTKGRKSGAKLSGGHFIGRLTHHFGLVSDDGLRGLSVVAQGMERQLIAASAAPWGTEDAPDVDEVAQAVLAPIHAPPPPAPAACRTMP
ncbi:hypothetical protein Tco_1011574 [Tanacetum coccineum]